jgi:cytochrome P450
MSNELPDVSAEVARGAAFLDEKDPDWWRADVDRAINLKKLDLNNACQCVLGQRYGEFDIACDLLNISEIKSEQLGFDLPLPASDIEWRIRPSAWRALDEEWRTVIEKRRAEAGQL